MNCKWIIENVSNSQFYRDLIESVRSSGRYCLSLTNKKAEDFIAKDFKENDCVMTQGSIEMTKNIVFNLPAGCCPIRYSSFEKYLCSVYYPYFDKFLFNRYCVIITLKHLKEEKFELYRIYGKEAKIFVRPDSGEKTFQAQLLDLQDFDKFWDNSISDDDFVVVSSPKIINGEYRFVCSEQEIIAQSTYRYQGQDTYIPSAPKGATEFVNKILNINYKPDLVFCVDVVEDNYGFFWLLELTSFSSAGLYACNKEKIVKRVSEIAELDHKNHNRLARGL